MTKQTESRECGTFYKTVFLDVSKEVNIIKIS